MPALPTSLVCDLYRAMLTDSIEAAVASNAGQSVLFWAGAPPDRRGFPVPAVVAVRDQRGADLGERLGRACAELSVGEGDRVVLIGADCPDLGPGAIRRAFEALSRRDLVLGPSRDGGYVLLGLRRPLPQLFEGVAWGTDRVLEQTRERARAAGVDIAWLEEYQDLDRPEDLVRFVARRAFEPARDGRRTEAALRAMGLLPGPA